MKTHIEPSREIPVLAEYDVVVCGGGPAGCAAGIAAARNGARTLVVEKEGYLGGATVSQLVCVVLSTNGVDFQGIWHEYARALRERDAIRDLNGSWERIHIDSSVDPEQVKFVWDELLTSAGADILHHAYSATAMVEDGVAKGVLAETRAGRRAILAKRVIDCTGDGIVAAQSGVPWEQGDGKNLWAMACTKVFRLGNVEIGRRPTPEEIAEIERQLTAAIDAGEFHTEPLCQKTRFVNYCRGQHWRLPENRRETLSVLSRVLKVDPLDPFDFTRAEREGRAQAWEGAQAMKRFVPGYEDAYLLDTSAQIGLRSSRRLHGIETLTFDDVWSFRKREDGIARGSWDVDVWPADSYSRPAVDRESDVATARRRRLAAGEYYDIPYGAIVAQGVDNLLMAGRCLSAEHQAEASLRIQQTCMATGEAAGAAAAISLSEVTTPRELDADRVVERLAVMRDVEPAFDLLKDVPELS